MLRQTIDVQVALFGRNGDGTTVVELVDWFVLDIRGVDHTSAARLLPPQVTPAEIADPVETELRSFSPKDIADILIGTAQDVVATQPAAAVAGGDVFVTGIGTSPGGVMLPVAVAGVRVSIHNASGQGINVFPRSGAAIVPNATDAAAYCGNNYAMTLTARSATQWYRTAYSPWA